MELVKEKQMKKRCSKCNLAKHIDDFYINRINKDGHDGQCKACKRQYAASVAGRARTKKYKQSEKGRAMMRRKVSKYRQDHPERMRVKQVVYQAIESGKIMPVRKCKCARCNLPAKEYHHADYTKPLDVTALCRRCHRVAHGRQC